MPTGYTQKLMETGESFEAFCLRCARAFGACVMMRDDDMEEPIREFKPSDFHLKAGRAAKIKLAKLKRMTKRQQIAYGVREKAKAIKMYRKIMADEEAQNKRLSGMRVAVERWTAPTAEHDGLKKFMLEQIDRCVHDHAYYQGRIDEVIAKDAESYYAEAVERTASDVTYSAKEYAEECERTRKRNEWVKQLKASLA